MDVNKIKLKESDLNRDIIVPIDMTWDFMGRGDTVDTYLQTVIDEYTGVPQDYELARFSKSNQINGGTSVTYNFNFWDTDTASYQNTYVVPGRFNAYQLYYETNPVKKSFFKMDLYDSPNPSNQRIMLSIILAYRQTKTTEVKTYNDKDYEVKKPSFLLDFIGEREGYFIYFFEDQNITSVTDFYMTAKFFSGLDGQYTKFTNEPQTSFGSNIYKVPNDSFYYKLTLDYTNKTYKIYNNYVNTNTEINVLDWYEYVNP
jgi:hypothetical protein